MLYPECIKDKINLTLQITEDPQDLLKDCARMSAPRFALFGDSTYYIFVEGNILCEVSSFSRALCLWFATHYIFDLEYCKPLKEMCLFLQEFVFRLPQKTKKTATYLTTSSDIFKYLSWLPSIKFRIDMYGAYVPTCTICFSVWWTILHAIIMCVRV